MQEYESFEVQGTPYDQAEDLPSAINQIAEEFIPAHAGYNFRIAFMGEGQMSLTLHVCEVWEPHNLAVARKDLEERSVTMFKDYEKNLKKEFKSRFKKALKLKEDKDVRATSVQRVSINDRYYFISSRKYDIS